MSVSSDKVSRGKHDRWIDGAEEFSQRLAAIPGVAKVNVANIRNSHVAAGTREPKLDPLKYSVRATYFAGGEAQVFYVLPEHEISPYTLYARIRQTLAEAEQRGGVGQSSKDEIVLPDHIRRRMEMEAAQTVSLPAPTAVAPSPAPVALGKRQAEAYEFVLSLAPDPQAPEFTLTRPSMRLVERFGSRGTGLYTELVKKELVILTRLVGKRKSKEMKVLRRPFTIVDHPGRRPVKARQPQPTPSREPVVLTPVQAQAYELALSLAPDKGAESFQVPRLWAHLTERLGPKSKAPFAALKWMDLIVPVKRAEESLYGPKVFLVHRRPFTVEPAPPRPKKPTRVLPEHRGPQPTAAPVAVGQSVLERIAAIEQQVAYFQGLDLTVELVDGKVNLRKS